MEIKVGMMVEVIACYLGYGPSAGSRDESLLGHVGEVIGRINDPRGGDAWVVSGAETYLGTELYFRSSALRPIRTDSKDIEETRQAGIQSWDKFMKTIKAPAHENHEQV